MSSFSSSSFSPLATAATAVKMIPDRQTAATPDFTLFSPSSSRRASLLPISTASIPSPPPRRKTAIIIHPSRRTSSPSTYYHYHSSPQRQRRASSSSTTSTSSTSSPPPPPSPLSSSSATSSTAFTTALSNTRYFLLPWRRRLTPSSSRRRSASPHDIPTCSSPSSPIDRRQQQQHPQLLHHLHHAAQHIPTLAILAAIFILSTTFIILTLRTLPVHLAPSSAPDQQQPSLIQRLTHLTLADIRTLTTSLKQYARTGRDSASSDDVTASAGLLGRGAAKLHVLIALSSLFVWKQAFTIPGSIIMNVIFGALYGTLWGTIYTSILTAIGGMACYLLCAPLGPLIASLPGLKAPLHAIRTALEQPSPRAEMQDDSEAGVALLSSSGEDEQQTERHQSTTHKLATFLGPASTWSYLLLLRLVPIIPYGLTNIACSVLRVPLLPYTLTLGLGSVPWNVLTCQVGELLEEVLSAALLDQQPGGTGEAVVAAINGGRGAGQQGAIAGVKAIVAQVLWKRETLFRLALVTLASLTPLLLARVLRPSGSGARSRPSFSAAAPLQTPSAHGSGLLSEEDRWRTSPASAPLTPLVRAPPVAMGMGVALAAPAPKHRPWWLDESEEEESDGAEGQEGEGVGMLAFR
ncbi:hypothetical protein V8E36_001247 [Tilletia maclaganii]